MASDRPPTAALAPGVRSTAALLAWVWAAAIVYASLYPFAGWHWPAGLGWGEALWPPWPRHFIGFDIVANLLGYLPLGLLATLAGLRRGGRRARSVLVALVAGAVLSAALEGLQNLLPQRVPSRLDWALNAAGTLAGALAALGLEAAGLLRWWHGLRGRWLDGFAARGFALLLTWPAALLPPMPQPLAIGQVVEPLRDAAIALLLDVPGAAVAVGWLDAIEPPQAPLAFGVEALVTGCGLLAPGLVGYAMTRDVGSRVAIAFGAAAAAVGATSLSSALNFGPAHALAWLAPAALAGAGAALGVLLMLAAGDLAPRLAAALGAGVLLALLALVQQLPADAYYALSLGAWERGQFVRFHGLARWIAALWPLAALAWLVARMLRRTVRPLPARRRWRLLGRRRAGSLPTIPGG